MFEENKDQLLKISKQGPLGGMTMQSLKRTKRNSRNERYNLGNS